MKANEFTEKWTGDPMICYEEAVLKQFKLRDGDIKILSKYGLPESAAPYLNFEEMDAEDIGYVEEGYYYLGYTGDGDWIGINTNSGKILVISHELDEYVGDDITDDDIADDDMQEEAEESEDCEDYDYVGFTLVNTSLDALYECMLYYQAFLQKRLTEGTEAYIENVKALKEKLIEADQEAMQREDCFWNEEIKKLL